MSRAELLAVSEKIVVDGSSLRQIYETHLVGERGLRRLVAEHLRGGNVKKALRREMVEREIDFERDPAMRDRPGVAAMGATTKTTLNGLLQQAEAGLERGQSEEVAFLKARAAYETEEQDRQRQQRKRIDIALTGTIALLAVLIALLVFRGN
jgi:hypothetical protein